MGIIVRYRDLLETYKTRSHRIRHLENYKKFFPLKSSEVLAGIVGDLISDGHLQGDPKWRIDFTSKNIPELNDFERRMNLLFETSGKIRECRTNKFGKTFNLGINCSPIARVLLLSGVPDGQKVLKDFSIPDWIKKDKKCFREFCKRVFSCEGCIMHEPRRKLPQIRLELWKAQGIKNSLMHELASYLNKHFNIKSTLKVQKSFNKRKDGVITRPIRLYIVGESIKIFFKEVGFEGWKQDRLRDIMGANLELNGN